MRISEFSHHLKKTSLWEDENQADAEAELSTPDILNKATATIRASFGGNNPENIWEALGLHLHKQLMHHKAVNITDFGVFGFDQNDVPIFVQDPVFLHMTRLCLASRKHGNRVQHALCQREDIVNVDLNELAVEYLQNCSIELVKSVISSVLAWVVAWAKDGQEMRLSLLPVGEWICNGDNVDFRFSESFRKDLELKQAEEERARNCEGWDNNQIEEEDQGGDQSYVSHLSSRTKTPTKKLNPNHASENSSVNISRSDTKDTATRNGSIVSHSRSKLHAPTFSSIAKQLPPHRQRRYRTEGVTKGPSSNSKRKTSSATKSSSSRATTPNGQQAFNSDEVEAVANDIIATVKNVRPATASSSRTCKTNRHSEASIPTAQQVETIDCLRKRISNRKCKATQGLNALAVTLSPFKTGAVSSAELSLSLRKLGVKISAAELKEIAVAFAHEKRGYINTRKLIAALRGPLSAERLDLIARVFHEMDPTCSGFVHIDEMVKHYDVSFIPQVQDGKLSRLEALTAFLQEWACINTADINIITFDMFAEYYHNVSACIESDDDFTRLMYQAWYLPQENQEQENQPPLDESWKNAPSSTSSARSILPFSSQIGDQSCAPGGPTEVFKEEILPSEAWSFLRALLLFPYKYHDGAHTLPTLDNMCRRLGANRVLGDGNETMNVKAFANELMLLDKRVSHKTANELSRFVALNCGRNLDDNDTIVLQTLYRTLMTTTNDASGTKQSWDYNYVEDFATRAIERIRARVKGPGNSTNNGDNDSLVDLDTLEKWLQASSSTGDSLLLKYELRSGLQKVGIDVTYQDLDYIFAYFDVERQGFINYEMLLEVLRNHSSALPKLTKRHKNSVAISEKSTAGPIESFVEAVTPQPLRRRKQVATREPQPNYRRRNLIHRAIYDQTTRPATMDVVQNLSILDIERRHRFLAAQLIQTIFRGFRARHIVAQLRRKMAAKKCRINALAQEHQKWLADRKKVYRTALPTAYGF